MQQAERGEGWQICDVSSAWKGVVANLLMGVPAVAQHMTRGPVPPPGPDGAFESLSYGNFDAEEALIEWEHLHRSEL
ncbi:hypothetical protein [Streptomyces olivaceoviridis]